jgi:hypothetical protein
VASPTFSKLSKKSNSDVSVLVTSNVIKVLAKPGDKYWVCCPINFGDLDVPNSLVISMGVGGGFCWQVGVGRGVKIRGAEAAE